MSTRGLVRCAAPLALLAVCCLARPAAAAVMVDLGVGDKKDGAFSHSMNVPIGQKVFFKVVAVNTDAVNRLAICEIPMLKVRVGNALVPFRAQLVLAARRSVSFTLVATTTKAGTFKTTALMRFVSLSTGRVAETADSVVIIAGDDTGSGGKKGDTGSGGQQQDDTGELGDDKKPGDLGDDKKSGGQQSGGQQSGGQQNGTGTLGGSDYRFGGSTGGSGDKKSGGAGGQQGDVGDKKPGATGGDTGGQQGGQQGGGQQDGGLGDGDDATDISL